MDTPIRIYVGSDQRQEPAERTLEYSIRKHSSEPVEVHFMRAGEGAFKNWFKGKGREEGGPPRGGNWYTNFSCFRMAVPEVAGFEGHAIYLDSDMFVLGDIAELFRIRKGAYTATSKKRTEVGVIDCAALKGALPSIKKMIVSNTRLGQMRTKLLEKNLLTPGIPPEWNVMDDYKPGATKLIHFTNVPTQPWKPWPEMFKYPPHPCPEAVALWEKYERESAVGT